MKNARGAGRKPVITSEELECIKSRIQAGESVVTVANEYGISRQALYKRLKDVAESTLSIDYLVGGEVTTRIWIDISKESLRIENFGFRISRYAFGLNSNPDWDNLVDFLTMRLLMKDNNLENDCKRILLQDKASDYFSLNDIRNSKQQVLFVNNDSNQVPRFEFNKKDILYSRTDTDGYQLKALSRDRQYFVKSQAIISGVFMDDWAVEILASDICEQLSIPCVKQYECEFAYGERVYKGVYSRNFELDGYTFISFERLLESIGTSSKGEEFICLSSIEKMKWCATKLSDVSGIDYDKTFKYMLDLAIVDCLVGNIDRHTRNFGLFYNQNTEEYEIPLIFDNGMGLFENDGYRDKYISYDSAMMHVYVSPYGEDPFDMIKILEKEYDLLRIYPGLKGLHYNSRINTPFALAYIERIISLWQK